MTKKNEMLLVAGGDLMRAANSLVHQLERANLTSHEIDDLVHYMTRWSMAVEEYIKCEKKVKP